jgi:hypothetical protein
MRAFGSTFLAQRLGRVAGSGWTVPGRRTFATGIVPVAALGEALASPSGLRSIFYAVASGTIHPEPRLSGVLRES